MKKTICLLCIMLTVLLCACGRVTYTGNSGIVQTGVNVSETETTKKESPTVTDGSELKNRPEIWAAKYPEMMAELNEFFIVRGEETSYYYYRTGSTFESWVNSELNIDKWYYHAGKIISNDGKWAIDKAEELSPMSTYEAKEYSGPTLSAEQRNPKAGVVYAANSCTPFTLLGLRLDGDGSQDGNGKELALKGIRSDFKTGETIRFYINGANALDGSENLLANKLRIFCLPHRDAKDYVIMSADNVAAISAFSDYYQDAPYGGWNFENAVNNDEQNNFLPGTYDILFYYENTLAYYVMINIE